MRRGSILIVVVALLGLLLPGSVLAGKPQRYTEDQTVVYCDGLTGSGGSAFAFAVTSAQEGSWGHLVYWAPGADPEADDPAWVTGSSVVVLSPDGTSLEAAFTLYEYDPLAEEEPFGPLVGEATMSAELTADGDPITYRFVDRFGNQLQRVTGTRQPLIVAGTLTLPEQIEFDLSGCEAVDETYTVFATSPATSVSRYSELYLSCIWETADGFVALSAYGGDDWSSADLYVSDPSGAYFGVSDATLTTSAFSTEMELFLDSEEGELEPAGSARASAALAPGGRINESISFDGTRVNIKGDALLVDGELAVTTPAGSRTLAMDTASCQAADVRVTEIRTSTGLHGPKPRNDTPDRAAPLAVGSTASVATAGAAEEPEAPCTVVDPETGEPDEIPIGRTAWWTFVGTGGSVTIDTSGSDFDTVVGVYLRDGNAFEQVACVDDVDESLLAQVTLETEAGVTYYIQAGGFGGSGGQLVVALTE